MTLTQTQDVTSVDSFPHVTVLVDRCAGCQECVIRCPTSALTMDVSTWTVLSNDSACVGCLQCVRTCPFSAITVTGPMLVASRTIFRPIHLEILTRNLAETRGGFNSWTEAKVEADRCLTCPDATCVRGCPAHNDIPSFIAAIRENDLQKAHEVLRLTSVLPDICSRVCDQELQCEGACTWSLAGGAGVAIGALERFITDNAPVPPVQRVSENGAGMSVAIVGSGPAAISAAWELVQACASVTVFEKDGNPGGLMNWGIPDFTLPHAVSSRPWDALLAAGVTLHCDNEIAPGQIESLTKTYDAVLLAHGAGTPLRLPVEGGSHESVWDATRFLNESRTAIVEDRSFSDLIGRGDFKEDRIPTVLVVGAGNTAMDVARLARRLGARAICVDWMDRRFAPVRPDELEEAIAEGVDIRFLTTIDHFEGLEGQMVRAHLNRTQQKQAGKKPKIVEHLSSTETVDLVVNAMGYRVDTLFAGLLPDAPISRKAKGLSDRRWEASGLLAVTAPNFARNQPVGQLALGRESTYAKAILNVGDRIWAAGDALVGPATVVEAMAQGRLVAKAILEAQPARALNNTRGQTEG